MPDELRIALAGYDAAVVEEGLDRNSEVEAETSVENFAVVPAIILIGPAAG